MLQKIVCFRNFHRFLRKIAIFRIVSIIFLKIVMTAIFSGSKYPIKKKFLFQEEIRLPQEDFFLRQEEIPVVAQRKILLRQKDFPLVARGCPLAAKF